MGALLAPCHSQSSTPLISHTHSPALPWPPLPSSCVHGCRITWKGLSVPPSAVVIACRSVVTYCPKALTVIVSLPRARMDAMAHDEEPWYELDAQPDDVIASRDDDVIAAAAEADLVAAATEGKGCSNGV